MGAGLLRPGELDLDREADPADQLRWCGLAAAPAPDEILEQALGLMTTEAFGAGLLVTLQLLAPLGGKLTVENERNLFQHLTAVHRLRPSSDEPAFHSLLPQRFLERFPSPVQAGHDRTDR